MKIDKLSISNPIVGSMWTKSLNHSLPAVFTASKVRELTGWDNQSIQDTLDQLVASEQMRKVDLDGDTGYCWNG